MNYFFRRFFILAPILLASALTHAGNDTRFAQESSTAAFDASMESLLKDLKPVTQQLTFQEGHGFHWECLLQRKFTYKFLLDVGYDTNAKKIEDVSTELRQLKQFVAAAESNEHGRLILENNTSGLPAFLILTGRGASAKYNIHHPMHDVTFTPADQQWGYAYTGELTMFARLPEIKRAQSDPAVRAFLVGATSPVRVTASGGPKTFFDCSFRGEDGKVLKVRVEGKNVTTLTN